MKAFLFGAFAAGDDDVRDLLYGDEVALGVEAGVIAGERALTTADFKGEGVRVAEERGEIDEVLLFTDELLVEVLVAAFDEVGAAGGEAGLKIFLFVHTHKITSH